MNILFFLKPKNDVAYIYDYCTLRQVLETMEFHKYASIPMLNKEGEYVGTMTEGDLLWGIKNYTDLNVSAKYCYAAHESRLHQNDRCKRFALCLVLTVRFRSLAPWGKLFQLFI